MTSPPQSPEAMVVKSPGELSRLDSVYPYKPEESDLVASPPLTKVGDDSPPQTLAGEPHDDSLVLSDHDGSSVSSPHRSTFSGTDMLPSSSSDYRAADTPYPGTQTPPVTGTAAPVVSQDTEPLENRIVRLLRKQGETAGSPLASPPISSAEWREATAGPGTSSPPVTTPEVAYNPQVYTRGDDYFHASDPLVGVDSISSVELKSEAKLPSEQQIRELADGLGIKPLGFNSSVDSFGSYVPAVIISSGSTAPGGGQGEYEEDLFDDDGEDNDSDSDDDADSDPVFSSSSSRPQSPVTTRVTLPDDIPSSSSVLDSLSPPSAGTTVRFISVDEDGRPTSVTDVRQKSVNGKGEIKFEGTMTPV